MKHQGMQYSDDMELISLIPQARLNKLASSFHCIYSPGKKWTILKCWIQALWLVWKEINPSIHNCAMGLYMKWNWPAFKWNAITAGIVCHSCWFKKEQINTLDCSSPCICMQVVCIWSCPNGYFDSNMSIGI